MGGKFLYYRVKITIQLKNITERAILENMKNNTLVFKFKKSIAIIAHVTLGKALGIPEF